MVDHKLNDLMRKITSLSDLSKSDKETLIESCKDIKLTLETLEKNHQKDLKETYQKLSQLEAFEIKHPHITSCIDILARTLSRLGV